MKKFLSLVLALVMTMSLVTISAGAKDFTDDDAVNYEEAIDVMSAVKVIDGYPDGSFKPQTALNRGQAAKILCNMILGPTTASALKADSAPFKDVAANSTFAGYIAYCAQAGIIDGYTDGTFKPAAPLTGYAFMKLLLGALGYDKDIEGYNVPNWSINVAKQALAIGLDDGLTGDFDGTKIVTREEACLFALNTMKADMVNYDNRTTVNVGGTEIVVGGSKPEVITSNPGNKMNKANLQFAEKYFDNLTRQDVRDDFGRPSNKWTLKTSTIGTYVKAGDLVASYTKKVKEGDLYTLLGSSLVDDLNAGRADLHVYMDGTWDTSVNPSVSFNHLKEVKFHQGVAMFDKNSGKKVGGTGVKTEVYVDDSGNRAVVTVVGVGTYLFQAAEDYNTRKETLKIESAGDTDDFITVTGLTLSQDDFDVKDVKADDYLLATVVWNGTDFDIKSITPAETKTGIINTYDVEDSMTIDGEELSYSFATKDGPNKVQSESYVVGENACVVLDTYGNVIGIDSNYVAGNYLYLFEAKNIYALRGGSYKGAAYFTDGTNSDVTVTKIDHVTPSVDILPANGGWYTFSKNSQNEYNLMKVETKYGASQAAANVKVKFGSSVYDFVQNGKVNFLNASATLISGSASVKGDSKTLFVVLEADDTVSTYTGIKNIPDICVTSGDATVTYLKDNTGYADYVFVDLTNATATIKGQSNSDFVYVVEYKGQTYINENQTYYTYKVLDENGDVTTIKTASTFMPMGDVFELHHKARTNADGYITQMPEVVGDGYKLISGNLDKDAPANDTVTYSNGSLVLGTVPYTVADDAKIVLVTKDSKLMKDEDADYEVYNNISARTLGALLKGYYVEASYAGQKTDATSDELSVLYVTVDALDPIPVP